MPKVLCDINIFQDILSGRKGCAASLAIVELIRHHKIKGVVSALTIPTLWYLNRKADNPRTKIKKLLKEFEIIPLSEMMINRVVKRAIFGDLEDEIQYLSAKNARCSDLITRNKRDFIVSDIIINTPEEFLENLK